MSDRIERDEKIRAFVASGKTRIEAAEVFGLTRWTIGYIVQGRSSKHKRPTIPRSELFKQLRGDQSVKDALAARVMRNPETGCLEWTVNFSPDGYGRVYLKNTTWMAHRVSHHVFVGPVPDDLLVCHRCDNPRCIEPSHLFLGTSDDNMRDMAAKGRSKRTKFLTHLEKQEIQKRYRSGERLADLGRAYNVTPGCIGKSVSAIRAERRKCA